MQNKRLLIILIILFGIAVVLVFFNQKSMQGSDVNNQSPNMAEVIPIVSPTPEKDQPQGTKPSAQPGLSSDEKAALAASSGVSNVDATQQIVLATKVAREASSVDVTGCEMDPVVLKVKYQKSFTLKNNGDEEVSVVFYADGIVRLIPKGGETNIKDDFGKSGSGLVGYYCRAGTKVHQGLVLMYSL